MQKVGPPQPRAQMMQALVKLAVANSIVLNDAGLLSEPAAVAVRKQLTFLADALEADPANADYVVFLRRKAEEIRCKT